MPRIQMSCPRCRQPIIAEIEQLFDVGSDPQAKHLDLSDVPAIDGTAALAVEDMIRMAQAYRQHLVLVGMQPVVTKVLAGLGVLQLLPPDHHHARRLDALRHAAQLAAPTSEQPHPASGLR